MEPLNRIKSLVESIRQEEGGSFEYDEAGLQQDFTQYGAENSSLAIKILSILGGFLASVAFLGFLFIFGIYESEAGMIILGVLFIIGALVLNRVFDRLIIDTFSISIYLIGMSLIIIGLMNLDMDENLVTLLVLLMAAGSLFIAQTYMLSFISVVAVGSCLLVLIISNDLYNLIHLYLGGYAFLLMFCFLNEARFYTLGAKWSKLYKPIRMGLVFSFLLGLIVLGKRDLFALNQNYIWLSSVVTFFAVLFLVSDLIKVIGVQTSKTKTIIYALSLAVLLPTTFAPAISGAILIILLCFKVNYKTGLSIGIIALAYFVSQYYYDLNLSLLTKSIILFASGVVFLLFYFFTLKKTKK